MRDAFRGSDFCIFQTKPAPLMIQIGHLQCSQTGTRDDLKNAAKMRQDRCRQAGGDHPTKPELMEPTVFTGHTQLVQAYKTHYSVSYD